MPIRFGFGDVIVKEGDPPDGLYVLARGSARVLTERDGTEVTLGRLGPGATFGEAALVIGGPRTATVRASERVDALRLGRDAFDAFVGLHPEINAALAGHLRMQAITRALRMDPVFSLVPLGLLAEVMSEFSEVEVDAGDTLVSEGGPGYSVYVVGSGRFVVRTVAGAGATDIGYVRAGDVVGERAAITGGARSATVVATAPGRALRLEAAAFRRLLQGSPRFAAAVEARSTAWDRRGAQHVPLDFTDATTGPSSGSSTPPTAPSPHWRRSPDFTVARCPPRTCAIRRGRVPRGRPCVASAPRAAPSVSICSRSKSLAIASARWRCPPSSIRSKGIGSCSTRSGPAPPSSATPLSGCAKSPGTSS